MHAAARSSEAAIAQRQPTLLVKPGPGVQIEGRAVDAVAHPGRVGTVREDVAEVRAALVTHHLGAVHVVAVVIFLANGSEVERLEEAGPPRAGLELGLR